MEHQPYNGRVGREINASDITRLRRNVFMSATKYCQEKGAIKGRPMYHAQHEDTRPREDGLMYRHAFFATINANTNIWEYALYQDADMSMRFDQLSVDERRAAAVRYQEEYATAGGDLFGLKDDVLWKAMHDPSQFSTLSLSVLTTKEFRFTDSLASKVFNAQSRIILNNASPTITPLGKFTFDKNPNDSYATTTKPWEDEDIDLAADLDIIQEGIYTVTTKDMDEVIGMLDDMQLISQDDVGRYVRGL